MDDIIKAKQDLRTLRKEYDDLKLDMAQVYIFLFIIIAHLPHDTITYC